MWDPGGPNLREPNSYQINEQLRSYIASSAISDVNGDEADDDSKSSKTELDSHANMPVVGKNAFIISDTGRVADVKAYTPDYDSMELHIVDAAVKYESPYDGNEYILVIRNALHVPSMQNNLIPPFMMREAGLIVYDTPKIQVQDPTEKHNSIYFPETKIRISMSLCGVLPYFPTSTTTALELMDSEATTSIA